MGRMTYGIDGICSRFVHLGSFNAKLYLVIYCCFSFGILKCRFWSILPLILFYADPHSGVLTPPKSIELESVIGKATILNKAPPLGRLFAEGKKDRRKY